MNDIELQQWVPYLIAFGNNTSAIFNGFGYPEGWLVLMGTQMAMVLYGIATDQMGFVLQIFLVFIAANNWVIRPKRTALLTVPKPKIANALA